MLERDLDFFFYQLLVEREGISIKKDMSIQFWIYQFKNYFINVGGMYLKSLEVFLQIYLVFEFFFFVFFILDEMYVLFYDVFDDYQLISLVWISVSEEKEEQVLF